MNRVKTIFLFILLIILTYSLSISRVSLLSQPQSIFLMGSLKGGSKLYIEGLGFSQIMSDNTIIVGDYPCVLEDGATATSMVCETTAPQEQRDYLNLEIIVIVNGLGSVIAKQKFSYTLETTPYLYSITPAQKLYLYGQHQILNLGADKDLGDIIGIYLGDSLCSRFGIFQQKLRPYQNQFIECFHENQKAGKYNVTEHLYPGKSISYELMYKSDFNNSQKYQFVVLPMINETTKNGSIKGQNIILKGSGFSANINQIQVKVDGVNCKVQESTLWEIKCKLQQKNTQPSTKLNSNNINSTYQYESGSGFYYQRYNIFNLNQLQKNVLTFKQLLDNKMMDPKQLIDSGVKGQIRSQNTYGTNIGQFFKGYFIPPVDGNYIFRGYAQNQFAVYLSDQIYGSVMNLTIPLLQSNKYQPVSTYANYYQVDIPTAESRNISLIAGNRYYMEVYHINVVGSSSRFSVSVEVPNNDTTIQRWQTYQVQIIQTSLVQEYQIVQFTSKYATEGTINFKNVMIDPDGYVRQQNCTINYNATADQFCTCLNQFDFYSKYKINCHLDMFNVNSLLTMNISQAIQFKYIVTIVQLRDLATRSKNLTATYSSNSGKFSFLIIQQHSQQISGTFTLTYDTQPVKIFNRQTNIYSVIDIPFDVDEAILQQGLRQIKGFELVQVERIGEVNKNAKWIVYFVGCNRDMKLLEVNNFGLNGGKEGTKPLINVNVRRQYNSNLFVDPIDYRFMSTHSQKPNFHVKVNNIPSVCNGDCSYNFLTKIPIIQHLQLINTNQLEISISNPTNLSIGLNNLNIVINQNICINLNGSLSNFTCDLNKNIDNSVILSAGDHYPIIRIKEIGIIDTNPIVNPISISFNLISSNLTSGGNNGGYIVQIHGTGFPLTKQLISFSFCNQYAQIKSLTNIKAQILIPNCDNNTGLQNIIANYKTFTATLSFTLNNPSNVFEINSINPNSWSPVMKGILNITGKGFGNDLNQIQVFLANSSGNVQKMKVLSVNDTFIKTGISGGIDGKYKINVIHRMYGYAIKNPLAANDFTYEVIITSISPKSGSIYGGTLLTITGKNFLPDYLDTMITIGNQVNQLCRIQSIKQYQIKCRTSQKSEYYNVSQKLIVLVNSKLIHDSDCIIGYNCTFQYINNGLSPYLTNISSKYIIKNNQYIQLIGTRLNISSNICDISLTNIVTKKVTIFLNLTCSDTTVNFTLNQMLQSGYYELRVRNDPVGQSNSIEVFVHLDIYNISTGQFSVNGGNIVINGFGFPQTWPNKYYNKMALYTDGQNVKLNILNMTTQKIILQIPCGYNNKKYTFSLTNVIKITKSITFMQSDSYTPTISLTSPSLINSSSYSSNIPISITLNRTILPLIEPQLIQIYSLSNQAYFINITTWSYLSSTITFNILSLNSGKYGFKLYDNIFGHYKCIDTLSIITDVSKYEMNVTKFSYNGDVLMIKGEDIGKGAVVNVAGIIGTIIAQTNNVTTFKFPQFVTELTQQKYNMIKNQTIKVSSINKNTLFSDSSNPYYAYDNDHSTIYDSNNTQCYLGIDIGQNLGIRLTRIRYFPNFKWSIATKYIKNAVFQASNDKINWSQIAKIDQTVHAGWNSILISNPNAYRYIRLKHNITSRCNLAQLQVTGYKLSQLSIPSLSNFTTDVTFYDGINTKKFKNLLQFRQDHTPIVTSISPKNGHVFGGYNITIKGKYLDLDVPKILIDDVECVIKFINLTQIVCEVGARLMLPKEIKFQVIIGNKPAILHDKFHYVMRWSDHRTWGIDLPPIDNDLVYIPQGMHLLVDQSTPLLEGIIVENGIIQFADQTDMIINTGFITINRGQFIAGTESNNYQHQLTFILHGDYYSPQQLMFGNKGIGCLQCRLQIHGKKRLLTWTSLEYTIKKGDIQLMIEDVVDWEVGESIVVASTSYDHNQAQQRIIKSISSKTIIVNQAFQYTHYGIIQKYNNDELQMRGQVGLLSRNIKIMGDKTSIQNNYGAHLMLVGSSQNGLIGKISYTQFSKCGQPQIVGRYCQHFHMNGDVTESYSIGNSVHHSMARVITIHGVHFLYVAWNVAYKVKGHNFFIQDGVETNNVLEYNLAISSLAANNMMQTDMSVASFWVTNPSNHLRYNHAAGSDFYGFWYEIKQHPDGPSATQDICPIGNPLGQAHDNVAHSNVRFGLRILKLYSRQYPCEPIRNDQLKDPWSQNPSIQSRFYNYILYKNGQSGLLAQQTGHTVFENFTIAESLQSAIQFYKNNFTRQDVKAINITIIGRSITNPPPSNDMLNGTKGIILPRTGAVYLQNIRFYEFVQNMTVWQSCSKCNHGLLYTNFGSYYWAKNISYSNINGSYYKMQGLKRQIFYDLDGTLTSNVFNGLKYNKSTLVYGFPHLLQQPACKTASIPKKWDKCAVCDNSVTLHQIMFVNLQQKQLLTSVSIRARQLSNITQKPLTQTNVTSLFSLSNNNYQNRWTNALPYVVGQIYQIWWGSHIDWKHLSMVTEHLYTETQPATIFKFQYIDNRQLYEIGPQRGGVLPIQKQFKIGLTNADGYLDINTCKNGDFYHDNTKEIRELHLCASGKDKWPYQYIDVTAVYCKYLCPAPPGSCDKQPFVRNWNNITQWPYGRLPKNGENVTIPCQWTIKMNINPQIMDYFEVNGDIIIEDIIDLNITANNVWIKGGSIKAGTQTIPFTKQLIFQLNGLQRGTGFTVDPLITGNKMFVVTGKLQLYGNPPSNIQTKLIKFANKGDNIIYVQNTTGWKIGDEIGIAPSFRRMDEFQKVIIVELTSNSIIFQPKLKYNHYGDNNPTIIKTYGTMDTRTGVAHLNRNIKFIAGPQSDWGFTFIQYGYNQIIKNQTIIRTGQVILSGVEFIKGGQYDTEQAAYQMINLKKSIGHTLITKSSFHDCQDFCMKILNINNVQVVDNVFFNGRKYHVYALGLYNFTFKTNLMIGVLKRPNRGYIQLMACFGTYQAVNSVTDNISVTDNLCQGSQGHGYIFPHVPCQHQDIYPFAGNIAGSTNVAFILSSSWSECVSIKGLIAYSSSIGVIHNPSSSPIVKFKNLIMADNLRSITIRIGGNFEQKTGYLQDSYITAVSRPSCTKCYGQNATNCKNTHAIRMLTTGLNGEDIPNKYGDSFDVVCRQQTIDGKVFINNTQFNNFRQSYQLLPQCEHNVVFIPHTGGKDMIGSHHLFNTNCTECQQTGYAAFLTSPINDLGWFGGCGTILCTGFNNYIVHDHTGGFLKQSALLLANNPWIGNKQSSCRKIQSINGHYCTDQDFAVLQYQSIAYDFNTRIMWPVYLTPDSKRWTSQTNGWRQWEWDGGQPLNRRLARFVSIVKLHNIYNMTFISMPPEDMTFKIQKRLPQGNGSDYVVIKLYYPKPNSIRVQVNGQMIKPINLLDNIETPLNTSLCGSNKFFYKNYTIHFVVTGHQKCKVRVRLTNSIQLTARFTMNINDFFNKDGNTKFINRMAALLNIKDYSRIKIVGIYTGSVIINAFVDQQPVLQQNSKNVNNRQSGLKILQLESELKQKLINGQLNNQFAKQPLFGQIQSFIVNSILIKPIQQNNQTTNQNSRIIIIVVVSVVLISVAMTSSVIYLKKRNKVVSNQNIVENNQNQNKILPMYTEQNKTAANNVIVCENQSMMDLDNQNKK